MSARIVAAALGALALVVIPRPSEAQRVSLSPTIGVYIPTSELVKAANGEEFKQEVGLAVGGRLGITLSPRFGIETLGELRAERSPLHLRRERDQDRREPALRNRARDAARHPVDPAGVAQPQRRRESGESRRHAYEDAEDKTDVGGVVGATLGFRLGSMLSFYVAAEDYIYGTQVEETGLGGESRTQNDVQIAVGFGFPVGR